MRTLSNIALAILMFATIPNSGALADTNVALGKAAWANGTYSTNDASLAVDGDLQTQWAAPGHASEANPYYMEVDLGGMHSLNTIVLTGPTSSYVGYTNVYNLYLSADHLDWDLVGQGTLVDTSDPVDTVILTSNSSRYIKYEVVGGSHWAGLFELEAYEAEPVPEPSSAMALLGLSGVPLLAWLRSRRS